MRPKRRQRAFSGVTRKSRQQQVNRITLVQHGLFALLVGSAAFEISRDSGNQWGAVLWALVMAGSLCTQNSMVSMRWDIAQSTRIALTAPVVVVIAVVLLSAWAPLPGSSGDVLAAGTASDVPVARAQDAPPPPPTKLKTPRRGVYLGAYDRDIQHGEVSTAAYGDATVRILHRYQQWWGTNHRDFDATWAQAVYESGGVPMITWEPWDKPENSVTDPDQNPHLLDRIARGDYDAFLTDYAESVANYRNPVILRFMHEMNGTWYPWAANINGNTPHDFQRAFRHVHRIFDRAGADNVSWVFSIDSQAGAPATPLEELLTYYPGGEFVDWVGLSGFNWGPESVYPSERSFLSTFQPTVDELAPLEQPVMLAEAGTSALSADPAGWLESALRDVAEMPTVKAMVWFNADTPDADFRLGEEALDVMSADGDVSRLAPRLRVARVAP